MTTLPELDRFIDHLRAGGHRVTPERKRLFCEIYRHHGHLDADRLLRAIEDRGLKVSRATLYRNLELMAEMGFVRKHRLGGNRYLYEHVHSGQRHDHILCTECGRVAEFVSPAIGAMQREIARAHGFEPDQHTLQIYSRCVDCNASGEAGPNSGGGKGS